MRNVPAEVPVMSSVLLEAWGVVCWGYVSEGQLGAWLLFRGMFDPN